MGTLITACLIPQTLLLIRGHHPFSLPEDGIAVSPLASNIFRRDLHNGFEKDDIIAFSASRGGALEPAGNALELVRVSHMPLLVLPQGHPRLETPKI